MSGENNEDRKPGQIHFIIQYLKFIITFTLIMPVLISFEDLPSVIRKNVLILAIFSVALITRFYNFFQIPFTHDELSALLRTDFDSFGELIAKGVQVDGHPALVQVFLYYWTKVFGASEWIVKLPFILTGLGAVYFGYKIGRRWMNETTGLLTAAFLATCEYTVMYSQIARPYTSGLFLILLMAYHWGEIVFFSNYKLKHLIWFPVAAALCAYDHHFCMLTASLIGLSGIFLVEKRFLLKYIGLCMAGIVLYLPHIGILLAQLQMGGLDGWLGKPTSSFLLDYFSYITHYSVFLQVILAAGWITLLILSRKKNKKRRLKPLLFCGFLFAGAFSIGYFYSVYQAPVLQFSSLIFAFPFAVLFVFGWIKELSPRVSTIAVTTLLLVNLFTLVVTREYYKVFYVSVFEQLVTDANDALKDDPNTLTLIFTDEPKTRFYKDLYISPRHRFITSPEFTEKQLDSLLKATDYNRVCICGTSALPPTFQALVMTRYPKIIRKNLYFSASSVVLGKQQKERKPDYDLFSSGINNVWNGIVPEKKSETGYRFLLNDEWGPGIDIPLDTRIESPNNLVDVMVKIKVSSPDQLISLVLLTQDADSVFYYSEKSTPEFVFDPNDSTFTLVNSLRLSDNAYQQFGKPVLKSFLWNKSKLPFLLLQFRVYHRKGNRYIYSLYEPIE